METHPTLFYFATTDLTPSPLALIIGREPNTVLEVVNEVGPYDFREYPRAGFWNIAYSLMAGSVGLTGRQLKDECVRRNASPILFGNALPLGIRANVANKTRQRSEITGEQASQHIRNLFGFDSLIQRVEMVLMSGLDDRIFDTSRCTIRYECTARGIHLTEVPFLFGPNKIKIDAALNEADRAKMGGVMHTFLGR